MPDEKPAEEGKPKEEEGKAVEELTPAQTKQALRYVLQQLKDQGKVVADLKEQLTTRAVPPREEVVNKAPVDVEEVDIDSLDNRGLVKLLASQMGDMLKPIQEQLATSHTRIEETRASTEVDKAAARYDDFFHFKDEIEERIKNHPSLSVDEAYQLAKAGSPEKVAALTKAAEERAESEKEPEKESPFGGLLPTSTIGTPTKSMSAKEAADAAWEETMTGFAEAIAQ